MWAPPREVGMGGGSGRVPRRQKQEPTRPQAADLAGSASTHLQAPGGAGPTSASRRPGREQ
jgi:hypothetical protein